VNRSTAAAAAALAVLAPALALTGSSPAGASSADARAAAPYKVVAKIDKSEVVADEDVVRISGSVKPSAAGQRVVLQQRREGRNRWTSSGTAKIRATGRYVLKDRPSTAGVRYYRVLKPAGNGFTAGKSRELKLSVWGWEKLVLHPPGANSMMSATTAPYIATESYPHSLTTRTPGTGGFHEYTLGRKCRALRATYALTDDSASGATGTVTVSVDGVSKINYALGTGVIVKDRELDVTNAFRIRIDAVATSAPAGTAAIGTPEVLCLG
jgi:hypothetical protein